MAITIRPARKADAAGILAVYSPYITDTDITFETEVPALEAFAARIERICGEYPYIVCEMDGAIVGYAYASAHRSRAAYRYSVDVSIYVAQHCRRKGIGTALYTRLFELLETYNFYSAYAGIALPNESSLALHRAFGFYEVGVFHRVGYKHDQWLDVIWLEKALKPEFCVPVPADK